MTTTILTKTDDSFSVNLPAAAVQGLRLQSGDQLEIVAIDAGIELRRIQSELERQMALGNMVMAENEVALRKLAE
ncbi:AbrB/MazE/SpoVT family DNA-binding domain-containing protein [Adhaeretor mobilis]|uniref:AbrB/MazE/SpoVT family DNA-binding domain-containing protein n=1 Tax=Adhaeretor mobilis TaxID=1930276 RepID=A0A517MR40_9BACT|nr:AbrB/MazE/SpoVT family DNA-binding domain-containing protein [Adhaeretor mobilis]QDS97348.1 hypothetical protein HG15A2_06090 [Adhaeretor mobilis]